VIDSAAQYLAMNQIGGLRRCIAKKILRGGHDPALAFGTLDLVSPVCAKILAK
jgi:hypothetical protein